MSTGSLDQAVRRRAELVRGLAPEGETGGPRVDFQPIVQLDTGAVVGYEALTRGPAGTALESPASLFAAARRAGQLAELDRACRDAALVDARDGGVTPPQTVFVNVEAETVRATIPAMHDQTWLEAPTELRCCIELTERALHARPADLLHAVSQVRDLSWGVALDDVGADRHSLALMPFLRPDVVKLDLRIVQGQVGTAAMEVMSAVAAQVEDTGAVVLAEGIEDERHVEAALALGATLGQGYYFGRPGALPATLPFAGPEVRFLGGNLSERGPTPFQLLRDHRSPRRGTRELVESIRGHIERQAEAQGEHAVVLGSTPFPDDPARERLAALAERAALVALVAPEPLTDFDAKLRSGRLERGDPLQAEWNLAVIGPHFAAAVAARQTGQGGSSDDPFEFAITHDRQLAVDCGRALMSRVTPVES